MTPYLNYGTATEEYVRVGVGESDTKATWRHRAHFGRDNTRTWAGVTMQIQNIPTDLLRTLIAVVDLRSFTKAAQMLGITQPAVSAQIKRLQFLLDVDVFDKSAPGVMLTDKGELVVAYARRLLSINDQILQVLAPGASAPPLRVGMPADFGASLIPKVIAEFQARAPQLRFQLRGDASDTLLRDLRQNQLDLAIALTSSGPAVDARQY